MDAEQRDLSSATASSSNAEPAIAALPLDLFGEPATSTSAPSDSAPAAPTPAPVTSSLMTANAVPAAPVASSLPLGAPVPAASMPPATPLSRLYDALGVLLLFVVIGIFLGAFTWRVLWLAPLSAAIYFWPLRRFRARWHARLDSLRGRIESA
jgi:hypothetical protein